MNGTAPKARGELRSPVIATTAHNEIDESASIGTIEDIEDNLTDFEESEEHYFENSFSTDELDGSHSRCLSQEKTPQMSSTTSTRLTSPSHASAVSVAGEGLLPRRVSIDTAACAQQTVRPEELILPLRANCEAHHQFPCAPMAGTSEGMDETNSLESDANNSNPSFLPAKVSFPTRKRKASTLKRQTGDVIVFEPTDNDYLTGRGGHGTRHPCNQRVRNLILELLPYYSGRRERKTNLVDYVIKHIHASGGRILMKSTDGEQWEECSLADCRMKLSQRFREETSGRPSHWRHCASALPFSLPFGV